VVGNGDQGAPLAGALAEGRHVLAAWSDHTFEPDPPIFTSWVWMAHEAGGRDCAVGFAQRSERTGNGVDQVVWVIEELALLKPAPLSDGITGDAPPEIGWHLHPEAQGAGYATEAADATMRDASLNGLKVVIVVTDPHNAASQRVRPSRHGIARCYPRLLQRNQPAVHQSTVPLSDRLSK